MNDTPKAAAETDYSATLFLPETNFPMRAGLPDREPTWLKRWEDADFYETQRRKQEGSRRQPARVRYKMHAIPDPSGKSKRILIGANFATQHDCVGESRLAVLNPIGEAGRSAPHGVRGRIACSA